MSYGKNLILSDSLGSEISWFPDYDFLVLSLSSNILSYVYTATDSKDISL